MVKKRIHKTIFIQFILMFVIFIAPWLITPKQHPWITPLPARAEGTTPQPESPDQTVSISPTKVKEGNDFATQILADPWQMNEFSDVSRYINESGVVQHLNNVQVANGLFSATSASSDAQFYTLFPGFQSSLDSVNYPVLSGSIYPIDSAKYRCLYTRMKINTNTSDTMRIFWFADKYLGNGQFGVTQYITIPNTSWNLYSINLSSNFDSVNSNTSWTGLSFWRGLRFDPTTLQGIDFVVDWVRLTDCSAVNVNVSWSPVSGQVEIWAGMNAKNSDFRVTTVSNGQSGSATIDVQGWQPGTYYIGVKNSSGTMTWNSEALTIDAAPYFRFNRPSFNTGPSITWTMSSSTDLDTDPNSGTRCLDYYFQNGLLNLNTPPPYQLPSDCVNDLSFGMTVSDPQLVFTMPVSSINTDEYRYLTIRTHTDGEFQDINHGWVMRLLWKTFTNNDPNQWCINVSNDIVIEGNWQTIHVDLHNLANGTTEDYVGPGNCHTRHWTDDPATWIRLDPNENSTSGSFLQVIDWMSFSKVDSVQRGDLFPLNISTSEPVNNLAVNFYYTTDRASPKQHSATITQPSANPPQASNKTFVPIIKTAVNPNLIFNNGVTYYWNTSNVNPGMYYICLEANDGSNTNITCSPAGVRVQ
jgi:hypothetical protein